MKKGALIVFITLTINFLLMVFLQSLFVNISIPLNIIWFFPLVISILQVPLVLTQVISKKVFSPIYFIFFLLISTYFLVLYQERTHVSAWSAIEKGLIEGLYKDFIISTLLCSVIYRYFFFEKTL